MLVFEIKLNAEKLDELREKFKNCLCKDCLENINHELQITRMEFCMKPMSEETAQKWQKN